MVKTIISVCVALALALTAAGCACTGTPASPSPALTVKPMATPMTTLETTPGMQASPDANASPGMGGTIENFKEGTEVKVEDVPEVKKAIAEKYPSATINSIKHAMVDNAQVYAVEIKNGTANETVYVRADGTILETTGA